MFTGCGPSEDEILAIKVLAQDIFSQLERSLLTALVTKASVIPCSLLNRERKVLKHPEKFRIIPFSVTIRRKFRR